MNPNKISGIEWTDEMIEDNHTIASTGFATQEGRGLGQMNFVIYGGLLTLQDENRIIIYLLELDTEYIFIPTENHSISFSFLGITGFFWE